MKKLYYLDESEKERILNMHKQATKNNYLLSENKSGELIVEGPPDRSLFKQVWDNTFGRILPKKRGYYVRKKIPFNKITYGQKAWDKYKKTLEEKGILDKFGNLSYIEKPEGQLKSYKDLLDKKLIDANSNNDYEISAKIKKILDSADNKEIDLSQYYIYDIKKIKIDDSKEEFFNNIENAFTNNTEVAIPTALENKEFVTTKFLGKYLTRTNEFEGLNLLNKNDETHKIVKGNKKQDWGTTTYVVKQTELEKAYNGRFVVRNSADLVGAVISVLAVTAGAVQVFTEIFIPPVALRLRAFYWWLLSRYFDYQEKSRNDYWKGYKTSDEMIKILSDPSMKILICPGDISTDYSKLCDDILKMDTLIRQSLVNFMNNFKVVHDIACVNEKYPNGEFWVNLRNKDRKLFDSVVLPKLNDVFKYTINGLNELKEFKPLEDALNNAKSKTGKLFFPDKKLNAKTAKTFAQLYPCFISDVTSRKKIEIDFIGFKGSRFYPLLSYNGKYYSEFGTCVSKSEYDDLIDITTKYRNNDPDVKEEIGDAALIEYQDLFHSLITTEGKICDSPCSKS